MRSAYHVILNFVIVVTGLLASLNTASSQDLGPKLQRKLNEVVTEHSFPGATLGIVLKNGKSISLAAGFEDPDSKTIMTPHSRMFCGSTGKTIVSAMVLRLVEQKKIKIEEKASSYFSKKSDAWFYELPNSESITVQNLLNHTSGLPRYIFQPAFLNDLKSNPLAARTPVECLSVLKKAKPQHEPGKGWFYSDSNYLILGLIIEKVTKKSFYQNAESMILKPFELNDTLPATQPKIEGLTQGHIGRINPFGLPAKTVTNGAYALNPKFEWCGGGFVTTSTDLAKWMNALHAGQVLKKGTYHQLTASTPFQTGLPGKAKYGLGTFVWDTPNGFFYGHAGVMPGYLTQIEHCAKHGFSIAFQTNTDEGFGRHHHSIVQAFAKLIMEHQPAK